MKHDIDLGCGHGEGHMDLGGKHGSVMGRWSTCSRQALEKTYLNLKRSRWCLKPGK